MKNNIKLLILLIFLNTPNSFSKEISFINVKGNLITYSDSDSASFFILYDQPLCGKCLNVLNEALDSMNNVISNVYFLVNENSSPISRKSTYISLIDEFHPKDIYFTNSNKLNIEHRNYDTSSLFYLYNVSKSPSLLVVWHNKFIYIDYKDIFELGYNVEFVISVIKKKMFS